VRELAAGLSNVLASSAPGLIPIAPFRWLTEENAPVRGFYEFQRMKGGVYSVRWGFDLCFSPWLAGKTLRWKRTARQAKIDLPIDPIDESGRIEPWHSVEVDENDQEVLSKVVAGTWERAASDFARVKSLSNLTDLFERRAAMKFRRFSLANYITTDLCWGLALHGIGQTAAAGHKVAAFCGRFGVAPNDRILNLAMGEARTHFESLQ
jgi:hypothetical protein